MKIIINTLLLSMISSPLWARQYIQCHTTDEYSSDVMVINLNGEKSTLFVSSGMQNPEDERTILSITLDHTENDFHYYKEVNFDKEVKIKIPSQIIGKTAKDFKVDLSFDQYELEFSCFSSLYE